MNIKKLLIDKINNSGNKLLPLDSEHFSMINSNTKNNEIDKVYITASGGPFYFKKNINCFMFREFVNPWLSIEELVIFFRKFKPVSK